MSVVAALREHVARLRLDLARESRPQGSDLQPPVLVEAASNNEIVIDERRLAAGRRRWNTAVIDHRAVQAVIGAEKRALNIESLRKLITDSSPVHEVRKTGRNQSPNICLGRAKRNDIRIDDPSISSLHAGFDRDDHGAHGIVDLGSRNGTFVNCQRVSTGTAVRLMGGDCVRLGRRVFYYVTGAQLIELLKAYIDT